jgi:uncharacterized protein (TIGR03118 family)
MKYPLPLTLRVRTLSAAAVVTGLLIAATFSSVLPISFALANAKARTNALQEPQVAIPTGAYRQTNLVSDLPGVALVEDRQLLNPWGIAVGSSSPFWVTNNQGDLATLYKGDVAGSPLAPNPNPPSVAIPNVPTLVATPSRPSAVVANGSTDFKVALAPFGPQPAQFIVATESGGINAWHSNFGIATASAVVRFLAGHSYTGLTIASNASGNLLFAADFANGKIDVFDKDFADTSVSGNFTDASIPANFHPYNIQNLNGALYVTYTEFSHGPNSGFDLGFVRKFDTNGVRDNAFTINNGPLIAPWGLVIAPANSGPFSNALLVGNTRVGGVSSSSINAFNAATGAVFGSMVDGGGASLQIPNLRALVFGNGVNGGDSNTLYFSAGSAFSHFSLFGSLKPVNGIPPSTIQFSDFEYRTTEGAGHLDITVTRSGVTTGTATVNYATVDGGGRQKSDYEIALGKLTFNPGETSKSFRVLIVDDKALAGGSSVDLDLVLSNATGAELTTPTRAKLYIMDDEFDTPGQPPNISDDTQFFVRQQYFDFLNREPDTAGFNFWVDQINSCSTQQCTEIRRINVSAAFFLSIEFQRTGMLAYLTEKAAFGGLPRYGSFMRDVQALQKDFVFGAPGADAQLELNKQAFFDDFVTRPEFAAKYSGLTNSQYVSALFGNAQINTTTAELYIAQLNSAQVVSPTGSPAKGLVILRRKLDLSGESVSLYLNGLTSTETDAHIHGPAGPDANAAVIATLPAGEVINFQTQLGSTHTGELAGGLLYVDVHTTNFPNGEIRGQLPRNLFVIDMIIQSLNAGIITRAQALRLIAESEPYRTTELNPAFVLMEYFGYLRRNPDDPPDNNLAGYNFWLNKLNQFNGNFVNADMVKAFIKSTEYRGRFGPP